MGKTTRGRTGQNDDARSPKRREITNEDRITWALSRYTPDKRGRFKSIPQIAEGRNPSVVSRAIADAFAANLVQVVRTSDVEPEPVRDEGLELEIQRRYLQLRGAIVVHEPTPVSEDPKRRNDRLHRLLGYAMADLIARGALFRDGDRIGVGSGRGVFATVDALARRLPLRVGDVTIGSLTGSVYAHDHAGGLNVMLDADNHTARFSGCFHGRARLHLISHPIAFGSAEGLQEVRQRTWLGDKSWKNEKPSHALIGVGALVPGHRLYEEAIAEVKNQWLSPITPFVSPLVVTCDRFRAAHPEYCPVIDLCNRFFYVPPPGHITVRDEEREAIKNQLKRLNALLLTVTERQLRQIDTIMLVAGGEHKALIIKSLLNDTDPDPYRIRYLCTDAKTVRTLLDQG